MVNWKVILVVMFAVGVVVVGGGAAAFLLAGGGGSGGTPTPGPVDEGPPAAPTPTATAEPTPGGTPTPSTTPTVTASPTASPAPTDAGTPTSTGTPAPMNVRQFEAERIESELRRLLNDWRRDNGLQAFEEANGNLVADLDRMATNHSVAMAEMGKTVHESNGLTTEERYHEFDLFHWCWYDDSGRYEPDTDWEVLATSYIGKYYDSATGSGFHEDEKAVARNIFERITSNTIFSGRLKDPHFDRIGIGIEITDDNEVWATGNTCSV